MKIRIFLALLMCLAVLPPAGAEVLLLPEGLLKIEEESFAGCETLTGVVIGEGARSIGDRAFSGCSSLLEAAVPDSVKDIGEDCFEGCSEALLLNCAPGSAALDYARSGGFDYDAETVCRALVVGQSYIGTGYELVGPTNDVVAVEDCLSAQKRRPFEVTQLNNLTAAELLACTADVFAGATDRDISLFYYSGHAQDRGDLLGTDGCSVEPAELRAVLDDVPGRKIVIIDACYSGWWVPDTAAACSDEMTQGGNFTDGFMLGFLGRARSVGDYCVIAAARSYEESWEKPITSGSQKKTMGCFTYSFCTGCGWDGVAGCAVDQAADKNDDGAVSVAEAYEYAYAKTVGMYMGQHPQTNAADCRSFAPFR